jgi:PII-like signaling protein
LRGTYLRFYVQEHRRHAGLLLYEWLLEEAKRLGLHGGSAFRAIAGFGRHGIIHEQHFFELAGHLTVKVEFVVTQDEAERMLERLRREKIRLVYAMLPAEFGVLDGTE